MLKSCSESVAAVNLKARCREAPRECQRWRRASLTSSYGVKLPDLSPDVSSRCSAQELCRRCRLRCRCRRLLDVGALNGSPTRVPQAVAGSPEFPTVFSCPIHLLTYLFMSRSCCRRCRRLLVEGAVEKTPRECQRRQPTPSTLPPIVSSCPLHCSSYSMCPTLLLVFAGTAEGVFVERGCRRW
jgi:hypothetical protein